MQNVQKVKNIIFLQLPVVTKILLKNKLLLNCNNLQLQFTVRAKKTFCKLIWYFKLINR